MQCVDGPDPANFVPGTGVLLACAVLLVAGYAASLLRGPAPSSAVVLRPAPVTAPAAEAPPGS
jgi:hypothetical protein